MAENEAELTEIPASEILDKIQKGEPVEYDHVSAYNAITSLYKYSSMIKAWLEHIDLQRTPYEYPHRLLRNSP